jgi:hypothetical protein
MNILGIHHITAIAGEPQARTLISTRVSSVCIWSNLR